MQKIVLALAIIVVTFFCSMKYGQWKGKIRLFTKICDIVHSEFYKNSEELELWYSDCLVRAKIDVRILDSNAIYILIIKDQLSRLDSSHLELATPIEGDYIWRGVTEETGLRLRLVEGDYVVDEIIENSPAATSGIQKGDIVNSINGELLGSAEQGRYEPGHFEVLRLTSRAKEQLGRLSSKSEKIDFIIEKSDNYTSLEFNLKTAEVNFDREPSLYPLNKKLGVLKIPHFRQSNFRKEPWLRVLKGLNSFQNLIIDLRGNPGGNFASLLRGLSPFFCQPTLIGEIVSPRVETPSWTEFPDDLSSQVQLELVKKYDNFYLKTFSEYGCFKGPLVVVTDEETSSSAEIYADSLQKLRGAKIIGKSSAGAVVMAMWYNFDDELGPGYKLSVPEKAYQNPKGEVLEFKGIHLDKESYYLKQYELLGQDSFLEAARALFN